MIFIIIGLLIFLYSIVNYRRGFIFYLSYKLFLVTNITLVSIPGLPLLTLEMTLTLMYIIQFFIKSKGLQKAKISFPFKIVFVLLTLTWLLSTIFAPAGFVTEISNFIKMFSENILLIWIMWEVIENSDDFSLLYKCITFVIFLSCIYGFYEVIIKSNPLSLYESTLNYDKSKNILWTYEITGRGYRINSIFEHAIGAGINWSIYSILTFWLWMNRRTSGIKVNVGKFGLFTALLCIPCVILTRQRGPIVFYIISSLMLINLRNKKFFYMLIFTTILILFILPLIIQNSYIFMSIFQKNAQTKVQGSSLQQRIGQFNVAISLLKQSPIFGFGSKFATGVSSQMVSRLLGLESVWLSVMIENGYFGIIIYIIYMITSIVVLPFRFKSRGLFLVSFAYWATYSVTSLPGMKIYLLFLFYFIIIKNSKKYHDAVLRGNIYGISFSSGKLILGKIKEKNESVK